MGDFLSEAVDAIAEHPAKAAYCAARGLVAGIGGSIESIPDAINMIAGDKPAGIISNGIKSIVDSAAGQDPSMWTPRAQFACAAAGIVPELATTVLAPFGALKLAGVAGKFNGVAQAAQALRNSTAVMHTAKGVAGVDAIAGIGLGVHGAYEFVQ